MKEAIVYYQLDCKQICNVPHSTRRHNQIPVRRLKAQLDQFLSQDDYLWEEAIGVQHKLQQLELGIRKLREETMQAIYAKKLAYALAYDKADDIQNSFKLARDGEWRKLTCANIFRVQEKINKGRKVVEKDLKVLAKSIIEDTQRSVDILVKDCFNSSNAGRYSGERQQRRQQRNRQEQRSTRQERAPQRVNQSKVEEPKFDNTLPTVKINKITQIDTHFNVILKVIKLNKEFRLGGGRKLQLVGGDQTGIATVVIDFQNFIQVGIVISISNARVYAFHGSKQIQSSKSNSEIKVEKIIINNVNQKYNLSKFKDNNRPKEENRQPKEEREERRERQPREDRPRPPREEKLPREDRRERQPREDRERQERPRRPREDNEQRGQRRRGGREVRDSRPYRAKTGVNQQDENQQRRMIGRDRSDVAEGEQKRYERVREQRAPRFNKSEQVTSQRHQQKQKMMDSSQEDEVEQVVQKESLQQNHINQKDLKGNFTKIKNIQPGDENLTILAEVFQLQTNGPSAQKGFYLSKIADETGIVRMELPKHNAAIKEGVCVKITNVNVDVDPRDYKITLKLSEDDGRIDVITTMRIPKLGLTLDMSSLQWQQQPDEEEEKVQKQEKDEALIQDF